MPSVARDLGSEYKRRICQFPKPLDIKLRARPYLNRFDGSRKVRKLLEVKAIVVCGSNNLDVRSRYLVRK